MKVDLLKKLIKEAVREVLIEELQLPKAATNNNVPLKEERNITNVPPSLTGNPLHDALLSTRNELSSRDYSNFVLNESVESNVNMSTMDTNVGLDLSNLDFVKKANKIYNLSVDKSKLR